MQRFLALAFSFSVALVAAPVGATPIVDSGTPDESSGRPIFADPGLPGAQFAAQEFTLGAAESVTLIEAYLGGDGTTTLWLTTAIGVGTTNADVITAFDLTAPGTSPLQGAWVGQAVALNLAAGTYFIVFSGDDGGSLPIDAPNNIGTAYLAADNAFPFTNVDQAFAPASDFFATPSVTSFGLRLIPEPSTALLVSAGLALLAGRRRGA